jgi:hypothetical protein
MDNAQVARLPMAIQMAKIVWPSEVLGPVSWAMVPFDDRPSPPRKLAKAVHKRSTELAYELRLMHKDQRGSVAAAMRATDDYIQMAQAAKFSHYVEVWGRLREQLVAAEPFFS